MIKRNARRAVRSAVDSLEPRRLFATAVGLTTTDQLVTFDTATPGTLSAPVAVTGLANGETLVGIDFRPATGVLYGLGSTGLTYTINRTTGAATAAGNTPLAGFNGASNYGFDFNPSVDRIRILSDADVDLRINPNNGLVAATDPALNYATTDANAAANPTVTAAAYSNNFAATGATTLYVIDSALNTLATQGTVAGANPATSPNTGTLFTVGALGVDVGDVNGFDISESNGIGYGAFTPAGATGSSLYTIDLTTGAATSVGTIGTVLLKGLSIVPTQRNLFALSSSGTSIATINTTALNTNPSVVNITGLAANETITAIDIRPATGQLFGLSSNEQLYTIDTTTGSATAVGTAFAANAFTGNIVDIDFNPTVDRIRIITDADENARANPDTGALVDADTNTAGGQLDTPLAYATTDPATGVNPNIVALAYTPATQIGSANTTNLFGIDADRDVFIRVGGLNGTPSPNGGEVFSIGNAFGVNVASAGLDISEDGVTYALINATGGTGTQLYAVNTTTGQSSLIGTVGDGSQTFSDLAVGDATPFPTLSINDVTVAEGNTAGTNVATFTVTLSAASTRTVTVSVASDTAGTAGTNDFTAVPATVLTFAPGETTKTVTVNVTGDNEVESDETVNLVLSSPVAATIADGTGVLTITNDDAPANPVSVAADPVRVGKNNQVLTVNGTSGDDVIVVQNVGSTVVVTINGQAVGTPTPRKGLYRVVINGGAGDDDIRLNSKFTLPGEIHGEAGNDLLVGSKGRDLLIGGDGVDALFGRGGEDILIGGISSFTGNPTATANLLNIFLGKGNFASRANAVSTGAGVNSFVFSNATISDDGDRDFLAGEGTSDLVFTNAKDVAVDEANKGRITTL